MRRRYPARFRRAGYFFMVLFRGVGSGTGLVAVLALGDEVGLGLPGIFC